ncbi:TNF receptor-associated factor 3 [Holothuria leucospilota]|uniref:TNF receptor-associated factor 3 n=1 Tax=Holothuria leucospilota TaxID=206669 RepID=A0A9Q1C581_HOLLE|nr:TNF receptor-associated factor 3 [Holothuria leucospilota]
MIQKLIPTAKLATIQEILPIVERNSRALASEHERSKIFWEALVKLIDMYKTLEEDNKKLSSDLARMVESSRTKDVDLHQLQGRISVLDTTITRLKMSVEQLENVSYNGVLIIEVPNYSHKKAAAMTGTPSFYSDDFYTDRHGYRMCARIYLNGDGVGKGSHLSIFFAIKKGPYDNYLSWPFQRRVSFTLLNQAGKDHLSDAFRPDPTSSSFQKPVKEMNIASGCPMFVAHKVIENPVEGFLRNNTICLRVKVDPSTSR